MGQRESDASRPVATWLNAPVPARPARRVWMIGVGLLAVVLAVALGAAWFDPPAEHSTPPAAGEAGEAGEAGGGPQVAARPDGVKDAASGQPAAEGERSDRAASGAAGAAEGASDVAAPKEATSREAASEPAASEAKASEAKASEAKAPDAVSRAVAAPSRRPDPALVRRTGDRAWFVQHAAVASADEARDWLAARPALDRAGAVPILSADGRAMVAIVTGPFPDRDSADRWAEAATPPDERWLRGARSLKAALRAP